MARQELLAFASGSATVTNAAKAISHADFSWSAGELAAADMAEYSSYTQATNYLPDGGTPTATFGIPLAAAETRTIRGNANIQATQFIRQGGVDSTMSVVLYKLQGS